MAALQRSGYDGATSLEIFNDVLCQADPDRTAIDGMRSLLTLAEDVEAETAPAAPGALSPAPSFVELATDPSTDPAVRKYFIDATASLAISVVPSVNFAPLRSLRSNAVWPEPT